MLSFSRTTCDLICHTGRRSHVCRKNPFFPDSVTVNIYFLVNTFPWNSTMNKIDNYFEVHFPGDGLLSRWRRAFYRFISVDSTSFLTKRHFKSSTVIKAETLRHLLFHRNIIHYFSRFRYDRLCASASGSRNIPFFLTDFSVALRCFWESLMMMTFGLSFFLLPFESAFIYGQHRLQMFPFLSTVISFIGNLLTSESGTKKRTLNTLISGFADIVCLMDVAINFRLSYLDQQTKEIVLEGRKIASRYIRGFLWADLLSSFPDRIVQSMVTERVSFTFILMRHCQMTGPCYAG